MNNNNNTNTRIVTNPFILHAIFLITTIKEIENNRFYLFMERLQKVQSSKMYRIPFYIFIDNKLTTIQSIKLNSILSKFKIESLFSTIEIVNNNILPENNAYNVEQKNKNTPAFGNSSGPNLHFYKTINYKVSNYKNVLILETDCFFIQHDWIDKLNYFIKDKFFWICGSKYYGNMFNRMDNFTKQHINGVAIYKRRDDFMEFIDFVFFYIKIKISLKDEHIINYDIAINNVIDLFNKRNMLLDSPIILNISMKDDNKISNYIKIKPNSVLVHQKFNHYTDQKEK